MLVTHAHMRSMPKKYCNKEARKFFVKHGLDWSAFVTTGIPEEELIATGDALALAVVEKARSEWAEKASQ